MEVGTRHVSVHRSVYESLTSKTISCSHFRYQRGLATDYADSFPVKLFRARDQNHLLRNKPYSVMSVSQDHHKWSRATAAALPRPPQMLVGGDPRRQYTNREPEHSTNGFPEEWREWEKGKESAGRSKEPNGRGGRPLTEALAEAGDRPGVGTPSRLLPWWRGRVGSGRGGFPGSSGTAAGAGWDGLRCAQLASETTKLLEMSPIGGWDHERTATVECGRWRGATRKRLAEMRLPVPASEVEEGAVELERWMGQSVWKLR